MSQDESNTAAATVVVRPRAARSDLRDAPGPLTSQQLGDRVGAHPDDLQTVRDAAQQASLTVVGEHGPSRRMRVEGPASTVNAWVAQPPDSLTGVVDAILGSGSPQAFPRSLVVQPQEAKVSYTPLQLANIYDMPQGDGSGETVAIIELGGGFGQDDLDGYFKGLDLTTPNVTAVSVDGAENEPGKDPSGADGEVLLDIEVAGALAPKAEFKVYFAPNTDDGFLDAVSTAAHADPAPAAISISWGQPEGKWSAKARHAMDDAFADAIAMGVSVTAAAGDNGSSDSGDSGSGAHTDFPASSPHVLGCGGTTLQVSDDNVTSETVWNDGGQGGATGGGVSDKFGLPDWQADAGVPKRSDDDTGRGVPDVAAVADPQTGYRILVDGQQKVIGGTSAVAPLWAGLITRIVQQSGDRVGLAQTALYQGIKPDTASEYLRDITEGSNGKYDAGPGWDPCTGLGVPDSDTASAFTADEKQSKTTG